MHDILNRSKILLEEWLNAPHMAPAQPQVPKWITLRVYQDHICDIGPARPMIPSCFMPGFQKIAKELKK